jgi:aldose 1-epimerase
MPAITLTAGPMRLEVSPELGGAITRLTHAGADLLRPAPETAAGPLETSSFPLAPYANRIAGGWVTFGGRTARLAPNMPGQPHPLHGEGWLGAWTVEAADERSATLAFAPAGGEWPWPYRARQIFALESDRLTVTLSATNTGDEAAPIGLGFHPYFPDAETARLTANTAGVWLTDEEHLPTSHVSGWPLVDWRRGAAVRAAMLIDHCHTGWDGKARIDLWPQGLSLELTASPELAWLHVYSPPGEAFFCVEPVSHRPDALNAADPEAEGVRVISPRETFSVWMTLRVV